MPTILIADDEPIVRRLMREILSIDPTRAFVEATNGIVALEYARATFPHLIILDIMMPKMDGLQVCRLLKADPVLKVIPVILVTASSASELALDAQEVGADYFVPKPFDEAKLLSVVTRALLSQTR